ncbi:hypothetical protein A0H81_10494 [Grifola frondosa]|uniref:Uncharacterized protein n=1 Tax=Grifola frondosa TaxID=5627 RepID=A0A1C7LXT3_GRIFR|nr:hypothetical protein A0H81_10494 [Grifola frondosa]
MTFLHPKLVYTRWKTVLLDRLAVAPTTESSASELRAAPSPNRENVAPCLDLRPSNAIVEDIEHGQAGNELWRISSGSSTALASARSMMFWIYYHVLLLHFIPSVYHWLAAPLYDESQNETLLSSVIEDRWLGISRKLVKQWKMLLFLCGAVLSATVALLQISDIAEHILTNTLAMICIVCALTSLVMGLIHLFTIHNVRSGLLWVQGAVQMGWPNVAALLAAPAAWLVWSIFTLLALVLSYVWSTPEPSNGTNGNMLAFPPNNVTQVVDSHNNGATVAIIVERLTVTGVISIGMAHVVIVALSLVKLSSIDAQDAPP